MPTNQPAVVLNGAGLFDFSQDRMLWRSTIGEEGQQFVRSVISEYSEVFKSLDIGIYFDDYVYIVKSGLMGKATMKFDKDFHEVADIDDVPKDGWMKVIFWGVPATIESLRRMIDRSDINDKVNFMASSLWSMEMLAKDTHKGVGIMQLAKTLEIEKAMLPQSVIIIMTGICLKRSVCLPARVKRLRQYIKSVSLRHAIATKAVLQIC